MIINTVIAGGGSPTPAPAHYIQRNVDTNGKLVKTGAMNVIDLTGVTALDDFVLYRAYEGNTNITGTINLSNINTVGKGGLQRVFAGCTGITSVNMSGWINLTNYNAVSDVDYSCAYAFSGCTGITSIDMHNLQSVSGSFGMLRFFENCTGMTSADLSSLKTIGVSAFGNVFHGCSNLASVNISGLETIGNYGLVGAFGDTSLTVLSFDSLKSVGTGCFNLMCERISNITLHFPSNMQSAIEAQTGYSTTAPFGATSGTVLFDLPATS